MYFIDYYYMQIITCIFEVANNRSKWIYNTVGTLIPVMEDQLVECISSWKQKVPLVGK